MIDYFFDHHFYSTVISLNLMNPFHPCLHTPLSQPRRLRQLWLFYVSSHSKTDYLFYVVSHTFWV